MSHLGFMVEPHAVAVPGWPLGWSRRDDRADSARPLGAVPFPTPTRRDTLWTTFSYLLPVKDKVDGQRERAMAEATWGRSS
jgi:hypothetical protein